MKRIFLYRGFPVCILLMLCSNCYAANQQNVKTPQQFADKLIAPKRQAAPLDFPAIQKMSSYCIRKHSPKIGSPAIHLSMLIVLPEKRTRASCSSHFNVRTVKRSILLFPGYGFNKLTLLPIGAEFAQMGFVAILVDLPGQGQSGGDHVGFGFLEARYANELIKYLYSHDDIRGSLWLLGISYGAAVAIDTAALNHRVSGVVALAPFARAIPAIKRYVKTYHLAPTRLLNRAKFSQMIRDAEKTLGYKFEGHNPLDFAKDIDVPVLYVAGSKDNIAPPSEIKLLARNTRNSSLIVLNGYDHDKIGLDLRSLACIIHDANLSPADFRFFGAFPASGGAPVALDRFRWLDGRY